MNELDIKKAVTDLLKREFSLPVNAGEVQEGFSKPSFFVWVKGKANRLTRYRIEKRVDVQIQYFQGKPDEVDLFQMEGKLFSLFDPILPVKGRRPLIHDASAETAGVDEDILLFSFHLDFLLADPPEEPAEVMKELTMKVKKGVE